MQMPAFGFAMWHIGFHHLVTDQHDISLLPLPVIKRLIAAIFKTVQTADLHTAVWPPA